VSDKFVQEQLNELQISHAETRVVADEAMGRAKRNTDRILSLRDHLAEIKRDMITKDSMADLLRNDRNEQVVRGVKYAAGLVMATIIVKWAEAMQWFQNLGN